ncbi:hypothetical protein BHE74_00026393 [Ensete ventricosum]|nr:hypothetical protein BHE74_00026393 [Ensete ventricosum]
MCDLYGARVCTKDEPFMAMHMVDLPEALSIATMEPRWASLTSDSRVHAVELVGEVERLKVELGASQWSLKETQGGIEWWRMSHSTSLESRDSSVDNTGGRGDASQGTVPYIQEGEGGHHPIQGVTPVYTRAIEVKASHLPIRVSNCPRVFPSEVTQPQVKQDPFADLLKDQNVPRETRVPFDNSVEARPLAPQ